MNRYPLWKYALLAVALLVGLLYTVPNFYGEAPAVQVSSGKATVKVDATMVDRVQQALAAAGLQPDFVQFEGNSVRARFADTDTQLKAKDAISAALNPDPADPRFIVALNLVSRSPQWMASVRALPMYLGLDLRGGVHFLMEVDMKSALTKRAEALTGDVRSLLREKNIRHAGIVREGNTVDVRFRDEATAQQARGLLSDQLPDLDWQLSADGSGGVVLAGALKPEAARRVQEQAVKQNITTLHNRVNELGVAEPVIQQQGLNRVVVQLPGVQDTAKAKDIIGRTATLEARLVDVSAEGQAAVMGTSPVPFGSERFTVGRGAPVVLRKDVIFSGQQLQGAQATFDENQRPAVSIDLNESAGRHLRKVSRENIKKPMAIVLFEKGRGEVLTVATIQDELGSRFRITGLESSQMANDLALLLRAGALAAPMDIIEERTIGPSLGKENIDRGFRATAYGFLAIALFMIFYYRVFGLISVAALTVNLGLLVGLLSLLQATLTLPGIAAVALTLGMAIDANVLINERVREELRRGATAQQAITQGYEKAFATILDSNVTTLIAGIALLTFGSGPVRGFAIVHSLGILTSIFSAVFVSRAIVNLVYGSRKKLHSISIGQVWKPGA